MAVNLDDLTNGKTVVKDIDGLKTYTWEGTAVFDVLVHMVNENLKIQYDEGRIKATDYAQAYIAGLQTCITEAMKFIMQKDIADEEARLKAAQVNVANEDKRLKSAQADSYPAQAAADLAVKTAQVELYNKQKAGFDDNRRQKLFEATVNSWALAYSSGILDTTILPSFINNTDMTSLFTTIRDA